ncbi:glycoside hydrolase family 25 protein [Rhizobium leguminosarum]|uniref:glycoside hydrolase family 25 protein n=1 Tax=Rhizobium leguminosarum TaxID=384 RepID=UPI0010325F1C|nr:GH25 family lysozyme [Rhizobium leguminosarum]TBG15991.1 hypothetical protein ELG80_09005 [Rhizobium leguminosarum]
MKTVFSVASAIFFGCISAGYPQEVDQFSRQELFAAVKSTTPGETALSFSRLFAFPDDARDNSQFGIDSSHHIEDKCHCKLDWNEIAKHKVRFVYLKATESDSYTDPTFADSIARIRQVVPTLNVGGYHFFSSAADAKEQAEHFVEVMQQVGNVQLPPSLDLEWDLGPDRDDCPSDARTSIRRNNGTVVKCDRWAFVNANEIISRANIWIDHVKQELGREPLVYTNGAWWRSRVGANRSLNLLHTELVWIADYSRNGLAQESPSVPRNAAWHLWQFTDTASISQGAATIRVDASTFRGSSEEMAAALGVSR